MVLLTVTAETWIVTGLGFGIVLVLLFCLVYIMKALGWLMQRATTGGCRKQQCQQAKQTAPSDAEKAAIAMSLSEAEADDSAAIAMALYLYNGKRHDVPTAMIVPQARETVWNDKSMGMNNRGF